MKTCLLPKADNNMAQARLSANASAVPIRVLLLRARAQ
jgi:hypothetical protein